jgi:flagellar FliL protein
MAKPAKAAPAEAEAHAKPKSKKLVLIIIGVLVLGAGGGAAWWFLKGDSSKSADAPKASAKTELPTFLNLDPLTVNLQHEEADQFLQIGITLKVSSAEMADKIRQNMPELRSHLIFLMSSKKPSELIPIEGKRKLAREIIAEANTVIGLQSAARKNVVQESNAAPKAEAASGAEAAPVAPAPAEAAPATAPVEAAHNGEGVQDVLFTAFIIQ